MTLTLHIDQLFRDTDLAGFVEVYFSEAFNQAVAAHIGLRERTLVESGTQGEGLLWRRVRMVPAVSLPPLLERRLGAARMSYDEVSVYDPLRAELRYHIESALAERVRVQGLIRFLAHPEGVRRVIDGEVSVSVPGLSGMIERLIEREVQQSYERIAAFLQDWLRRSAA